MSTKDYNAPMHTAEHLLNGWLTEHVVGTRAHSTHIERRKSKIDFRFDRDLTPEEIARAEAAVNRAIEEGVEVTSEVISLEEASRLYNITRLPEDATSDVRVVHIGGYDSCPCIGGHVEHTSQISGSLKIISSSYTPQSGILRVRFKIV